ncbi:myo-inosose-2 dehydratase [Lentisphaerota bacterium ZTH]|nr:myo-inosose-2 dehydratase [Lentisphaerota bacterium]WET07533.1 myo-inosose-2 dehydratase [Lentisphaerota bacterium ZTH]
MFKSEDVKLSIAPIAWTNDDLPELGGEIPFEQCVDEMAAAGFIGCEVGNKYPKDKHELKAELNKRGLQVSSAWFSSFFTDGKKEETIKDFIEFMHYLKHGGATVVNVCECGSCIQGQQDTPILEDYKPVFTEEQWQMLAEGLNEIGKIAVDNDMKVAYHFHMGTGVQNMDEVDQLMAMTDPQYVYLLLDTGHTHYAGGDNLELIKKYGDRIGNVHLKDIRDDVVAAIKADKKSFLDGVKAGTFTIPGDGNVDFEPIFEALSELGYKGWFVVEAEQDPYKANPFEYAKIARAYIKEKTGL